MVADPLAAFDRIFVGGCPTSPGPPHHDRVLFSNVITLQILLVVILIEGPKLPNEPNVPYKFAAMEA